MMTKYCGARLDEYEANLLEELENCPYCGAPLDEGCECLRELAEYEADMIEELENSPETQLGYRQQDLIDLRRFEQ